MRREPPALSRRQALRLVEGAYLAATTGLIWLALYYLPVGGALFRLALPLPLTLLQLRRGDRSGVEGLLLAEQCPRRPTLGLRPDLSLHFRLLPLLARRR